MKAPQTNEEKAELFLSLFCGREDIFPKRWENKNKGRSGYAPACENEWVKPICQKPQIKCGDCQNQKFLPLNAAAVGSHLRGSATIGTYAIRVDDTCSFLACDFDESSWQADLLAYRDTAHLFGIDVAMERSRSGKGGHAWIFFAEPVPARLARSLGTLIIAKCSERNIRLSLESYDRFFPTQDFLPRGGFGKPIFAGEISLMVYPVETIFAEKLETIISKGAANSRMKDYHDVILMIRETGLLDSKNLEAAIKTTFDHRQTQYKMPLEFDESGMNSLQELWTRHLTGLGGFREKLKLPEKMNTSLRLRYQVLKRGRFVI